jgi:predicted MFS family arabinose efflux permease
MNIWLILIAFAFHFTRHGISFPLIPLLAENFGAAPSEIGFVVGAFGLIGIFLSIPLGGLIDRVGPKRMLVFGVISNIANAAILLHASTISELIIAQMIAGLAFTLIIVGSQALISKISNPSEREKAFGFLSIGASIGLGLGPVLGGFLVERFDYRTAFYLVLIFSTMGLLVLGIRGPKEPNSLKRSYSLFQDARLAGDLALNPQVMIILVFTFVVLFAVNLNSSFLPVLLRGEGLKESLIGALLSVFALNSIGIRLFFSNLLAFTNRKKIIALAMGTIIAGVGLIPLMSSLIGFAMALSIYGVGFGITQPLSMVMIADLTDPSLSGLAMGLRFTVIMAANLLSPVILGFTVDIIGLKSVFYFAAFVVSITAIYILVIRPGLIPSRRM